MRILEVDAIPGCIGHQRTVAGAGRERSAVGARRLCRVADDELQRHPLMANIACFGALHTDRRATARAPIELGSSNPVEITEGFGGVARNIAENLARFGEDVTFVGRVGTDAPAAALVAHLASLRVDSRHVTRSPDSPTGSYTALLSPDGELVVAMADVAIHDELIPDVVELAAAELGAADLWILDTNLPTETLRHLIAHQSATAPIAVDGVSVAKVSKLAGLLSGIDVLFVNEKEASTLATGEATTDYRNAADALRDAGAGTVVVGRGTDGIYLLSEDTEIDVPALPADIVDVTGAGDSLVAGLLHAHLAGSDWEAAARFGVATATLTVEHPGSVWSEISERRVRKRLGPT